MNFRAGQRVVCIDAVDAPMLTKGHIYTIRRILPAAECLRNHVYVGKLAPLELHETEPEPGKYGFDPARFRPIVDRKTDISIFQKMLTPKKVKSNA